MNSRASPRGWILILIIFLLERWSRLTICKNSPPTLSEDFIVFYLSCSISIFTLLIEKQTAVFRPPTVGEMSDSDGTLWADSLWLHIQLMRSSHDFQARQSACYGCFTQALWLLLFSFNKQIQSTHVFSDSIPLWIYMPQEVFKCIFCSPLGNLTMDPWN